MAVHNGGRRGLSLLGVFAYKVPKWNMSQFLWDKWFFCSIPLRVCGKVVILQCRSGTFRAYSVTAPKGSR